MAPGRPVNQRPSRDTLPIRGLMSDTDKHQGSCACGAVSYSLKADPLIVHACHCTRCQRQTGAAFAVNALIETDAVEVHEGAVSSVHVPTVEGRTQEVVRCEACGTALWSHYAFGGLGKAIAFVRVGTLDDAGACPPDVHIFTETKVDWLELPSSARSVPEYYVTREVWPDESRARLRALVTRARS